MKTKTLLKTTGLTILIMLLNTGFTAAQIPMQGLAQDHEGVACWDADGSGPEAESYGHTHPFDWGSSLYYAASRDYDAIDPDPGAAMCHLLDNISGFPLFVEALAANGFTAGQVKIKTGLFEQKNDLEGEDWFTFNNMHYYNRYDAYYYIELDGEPMISGHLNYLHISISSTDNSWLCESNYSMPVDNSESSSPEVQAVANAMLADMDGQELRFIFNVTAEVALYGNGRAGAYFNVDSGYLEKGWPELPFNGLAADHEGLAAWDADGTGPEPEGYGHTFYYGGYEWWMAYYIASCDYDDIDEDPNAALGHFTDDATGFPNLETQLAYRDYTIDQLMMKSGIGTLGNDIEGVDWGLDEGIHWYHFYGNTVTFELDGEPILEWLVDTNFSFHNLEDPNSDWWSYTSYGQLVDISESASAEARYVAGSLLKDIGDCSVKAFTQGNLAEGEINANGRSGVFHEYTNGYLTYWCPDPLVTGVQKPVIAHAEYLIGNYPNPFSGYTVISFELQHSSEVEIAVYSHLGQLVEIIAKRDFQKGKQQVYWQTTKLHPGIYFLYLRAGNDRGTTKMIKR